MVYIKKLEQLIVHTDLLNCLKKDSSVLLKVIILEQVNKFKNNGLNFFKNTIYMSTILITKLCNFRKRKTHIAHHRVHVENLLKGLISINSSRLTSMLYILSSKNPTNSNVLKSCYSICFVLVGVMKYLFAILTCYINNF